MEKLTHGGDIYSARERIQGEIIDFSANINPMGLPESVKTALCNSMDLFSCYPDPLCRELVSGISAYEQIPQEMILCGNGAADIIFRIVQAMRAKSALIPAPTFAEYEQALTAFGCEVNYYPLKAEQDFMVLEDILEYIHPSTGIVFLCNPNNPTGQLIDRELLEKILARCVSCGTLLVMDECFRDFLDDPEGNSMKGWVESFPNLLILRAFTKHFAMPGLRLGYCLCSNPLLMERMKNCGQPWSVSVPAQIAGVAALQDKEYWEKSKQLLKEEKEYLLSSLEAMGIHGIGSKANYIFFFLADSECLLEKLEGQGILIRDCSNYRGLCKGYYRIAVKSHKDNEKLIQALNQFLNPAIGEPLVAQTVRVSEHSAKILKNPTDFLNEEPPSPKCPPVPPKPKISERIKKKFLLPEMESEAGEEEIKSLIHEIQITEDSIK